MDPENVIGKEDVETGEMQAAVRARARIEGGLHDPAAFRATLLDVAPAARDAWLDAVLGLGEIPDDGPDLPRECVPYLPCPIDALLRMIDRAQIRDSDVFVDIGSGIGRAAAIVHLLTGAAAIGIEIQPGLAAASRRLASRLRLSRMSTLEGDAADLGASMAAGTVFFLYCPFSGRRLAQVLEHLEPLARARPLRICCVDLPLPSRDWLVADPPGRGDLTVHRTTLHA